MLDLGFVIRRYDSDLLGGAETLVRQFSRRLADLGYGVEVLTTCIRDYHKWNNSYPHGVSCIDGIRVRRFPIWTGRNSERYRALSHRIGRRLAHSVAEGYQWLHEGLHSPALYQYLQQKGRSYRLLVVVDYSAALSLYALAANPGRTVAWPLLHNEPVAYLPAVRHWLYAAHGLVFNVLPERDFARYGLGVSHPRTAIVGVGVETALGGQADRFRQRFGIDQPFLLYVGRLDASKNLPLLISYFQRYRAHHRSQLKLVLLGDGPYVVPSHPDILTPGRCSEEDKMDAYAAALALCQPSLVESFSIVALEALTQRTPILAHGANDVTRYHCLAGNCGLYFYGYADFALTLNYLQTHPDARQQLGQSGRDYVEANYAWDRVMERLLAAVERFGS